ncbi:MAG: hypothetical protein AB1801_11490 [Chloroflexota bacterium]
MSYVPISKLRLVDEQTADGKITALFDDIRRELGVPHVGPAYQIAALSPAVLVSAWGMYRNFIQRATLPLPLLFMIHYTISSAKNCQYCSTGFKVACRSVGVDEEMLEALVSNLDAVNPKRVQEIIKFAVKCALNPQGLTGADYDRVRDQGVSDEELVEIIGWAAIAIFNDTTSDALKLGDPMSQQFIED